MVEFAFPTDTYVLIGKITKAHGIKGEVKIRSFSDQPQNFEKYKQLFLVSEQGRLSSCLTVRQARAGTKEVLVMFEGVTDRDGAEALCGHGVLIPKKNLPTLSEGEFYLHELEGLRVITDKGKVLGTVHSFINNGAQDIIVVRNNNEEFLIPLIPGMIVKKDEAGITVAPPPGLLEINSRDEEGHEE